MFKPPENTDPLQAELDMNFLFSQKGQKEELVLSPTFFHKLLNAILSLPLLSPPWGSEYGAESRENRANGDRHGSEEGKRKIL